MSETSLKEKLMRDLNGLSAEKVREVIDFVEYLKLKEDDWFIAYVNKRGTEAKTQKKAGKKFTDLYELQKEYR